MSLKILHTADWHLGKKLDHFSRLEEQIEVLKEICEIANEQKVDMVLVAGDLFDTFNPPVEAIDLFYKTLKNLANNGKRPVIAIAGNHDSPDRIDAPNPIAKECGIIFVGNPETIIPKIKIENGFEITQSDANFFEIKLKQFSFPIRVIATPYANELRLKTYLEADNKEVELNQLLKNKWKILADHYCDEQGVNILTTHLYVLERNGLVLEEPEGEKPLKIGNAEAIYTDNIPPQIQYTALGHLHNHILVKGHANPVVYSSSPLAYSFSEAGKQKKVIIAEISPKQKVKMQAISLSKGRELFRVRFDKIDEAIDWLKLNPYTLVELTLISDTYISNEDMKRLYDCHDGIIHVIPIISNDSTEITTNSTVNLDQDMVGLFNDFFQSKNKGQLPNEELIELFKEVVGIQIEDKVK
jgi:DNA repair protein SbcD/Mre11